MVRRQGHRIIEALPVQTGEKSAEITIEREHLEAHFATSSAIAVPDVVCGGETNGEDVRRRAPPQTEVADHGGRQRQRRPVELGRNPEALDASARALEPPAA